MPTPELLDALGSHLGLPGLSLDAQGRCGLRLGDVTLDLEFPEYDECLRLTGLVGAAHAASRRQLLASLLVANLFLTEHGRPHAAFDPREDRVALSHSLSLQALHPQALAAEITRFANHCRALREQLGAQLVPAA